jgi:membrane-anchored protein YejM (alkaline phosphatase superfamily)
MGDFAAVTIATAVVAIYLVAITFAILHIERRSDLGQAEKVVWVVAVFFAPVVSAIVWFAAGPHPFGFRITRDRPK